MKFLFLSSYAHLVLDPESDRVSGGAELQVALLARELVRQGHEVVVVGGDIGQADGTIFSGVKTRNGGKFQTGGLVDTARALPIVQRIIAEEKPDYVGILGWTTWLYFLYRMRKTLGFRLIFICGLDTEVNGEFRRAHPIKGYLFEYAMRHCEHRFAMTEDQERMCHPAGMDCHLYRNLIMERPAPRTAEKSIDLLWIARCQHIKRPHLFLDLAEAFPDARCEMVCVREDIDLWETVAARAKTLPNVKFLERVPYHEVQAHYDAARIFVNTSTFEGWPNSFIQSGLGHCALLSLSVNPDQLFQKYRLGTFADHDIAELHQGARSLLGDAESLEAQQAECARFVAELHDNTRNTERFLKGLQ